MSDLLTKYIFAKDFKRFGQKIVFKNETSQTFFMKEELITVKQLKPNGIIIELPNNLCQKGHTLTLYFFDYGDELNIKNNNSAHGLKDARFQIIAKVESTENFENRANHCSVNLTFIQYDVKGWNSIIDSHDKRQEEINELISKQFSRGEDE